MANGGYTSGAPVELRPPQAGDVEDIRLLVLESFPQAPERSVDDIRRRLAHLVQHADDTSLVARDLDSGALLGVSLAMRRGSFWGLGMLFVAGAAQSRGLGRRLLELAPTAAPGLQRVITSSTDPRAMRRYASLGLALHPTVSACEVLRPHAVDWPQDARHVEGAEATALIDRLALGVRGAPYGPDAELVPIEDRVIAVGDEAVCAVSGGTVRLLLATSENAAAAALRGALATIEPGTTVHVRNLRGDQQWAIRTVLHARLALSPDGPTFSDAPLSPLHIPSGVFF